MPPSVSPAESGPARSSASHVAVSVVFGVATGVLVNYAIAVAPAVRVPPNYTISPLALALIAVIGAVAIAIAWRWPIVGLTAGLLIVAIVVVGIAARWGWSSAESAWLDPLNALAFGTATGYPVLIGAAMATASGLRLRAGRT